MLQVDRVTVSFGGIRALTDVSVDCRAASITGLIGPNGAGKTTLFNVVTGLLRPNGGRILLDGADVTGSGPKARAQMGVARTFQRLEVFGSLTVVDNVMVALENRGVSGRSGRRRAAELLESVGLSQAAAVQADVLPTGSARLLELARALACQPRLLLLDEPFSGLDTAESLHLATLLQALAGDGLAVLLVEHDMAMVMRLCRRVHVLSFGELLASGPPLEIGADPAVQEAYLGPPPVGSTR